MNELEAYTSQWEGLKDTALSTAQVFYPAFPKGKHKSIYVLGLHMNAGFHGIVTSMSLNVRNRSFRARKANNWQWEEMADDGHWENCSLKDAARALDKWLEDVRLWAKGQLIESKILGELKRKSGRISLVKRLAEA